MGTCRAWESLALALSWATREERIVRLAPVASCLLRPHETGRCSPSSPFKKELAIQLSVMLFPGSFQLFVFLESISAFELCLHSSQAATGTEQHGGCEGAGPRAWPFLSSTDSSKEPSLLWSSWSS